MRAWLALAGAALVLAACLGPRAYSDYDPNAVFDRYQTFAWLREGPDIPTTAAMSEDGIRGLDPLLARRIRSSVEEHLEAKGYRMVEDRKAADFVVDFSVARQEKVEVYATPSGWGGRYGGWYATDVSAHTYVEGTLSIDVFDGRSQVAVWHGWASKRVTDSMDRAVVVDEVVGAVLKRFPPER